MAADPAHHIIIQDEAFGAGFDVLICPKPNGESLCREFPRYSTARAYAEGIAAARGWPIRDDTGRATDAD